MDRTPPLLSGARIGERWVLRTRLSDGSATDIIVSRARDVDGLSTMVGWSLAAHVVVMALIVFVPHPKADVAPKDVMMISFSD